MLSASEDREFRQPHFLSTDYVTRHETYSLDLIRDYWGTLLIQLYKPDHSMYIHYAERRIEVLSGRRGLLSTETSIVGAQETVLVQEKEM